MLFSGTAWGAEEVVTDTGNHLLDAHLHCTGSVHGSWAGHVLRRSGAHQNVIGTMMHSFAAMVIIGVLWPTLGYALSFGPGILGGFVGWDSKYFQAAGHR